MIRSPFSFGGLPPSFTLAPPLSILPNLSVWMQWQNLYVSIDEQPPSTGCFFAKIRTSSSRRLLFKPLHFAPYPYPPLLTSLLPSSVLLTSLRPCRSSLLPRYTATLLSAETPVAELSEWKTFAAFRRIHMLIDITVLTQSATKTYRPAVSLKEYALTPTVEV